MVEIYFKSPVRPIGKSLFMKFSENTKTHKDGEKWPLFVNKWQLWWSTTIAYLEDPYLEDQRNLKIYNKNIKKNKKTLDNNNGVLTTF